MSLTSRETHVLSQLAYMYLLQGYLDRASVLYAALHVIEPDVLHHLRGIALANSRAGRHDRALTALDTLALRGAVDAPYYSLRSRVLADLGRIDESQAAMRSYLSLRSKAAGPQDKPMAAGKQKSRKAVATR